jgi:hypothetical protein
MKTNVISAISVRICSVFIPTYNVWNTADYLLLGPGRFSNLHALLTVLDRSLHACVRTVRVQKKNLSSQNSHDLKPPITRISKPQDLHLRDQIINKLTDNIFEMQIK